MIYLQFSESKEENVKAMVINKPRFTEVLEKALKEFYQEVLAKKYAKELGEILYKEMEFPTEGIYCVNHKSKTLNVFLEKSQSWIDTGKTLEDYTIEPDDKLWDRVFSKMCFLREVAELIKETIKPATKNMFNSGDMKSLITIEMSTEEVMRVEGNTTETLNVFKKFFAEKKAEELYCQAKKTLFLSESDSYVVLLEYGKMKAIVTQEGVTQLRGNQFDLVRKSFKKMLAPEELKIFMRELRNRMLYGERCERYEIHYRDKKGKLYSKYKGVLLEVEKTGYGLYMEATEEILNSISREFKNQYSYNKEEYEIPLNDGKIYVKIWKSGEFFKICINEYGYVPFAAKKEKRWEFYFDNILGKQLMID